MSVTDNTRPPYVRFERRPVEDRAATISAGHYVAKDVDFALITRPGDRDTLETEATAWLAGLREKARGGSIPDTWARGFTESYENWKKGEEPPISGTPIKGWAVLSPASQEGIIRAGILSVEDLAEISESSLGQLGTGALSYKLKAQAWLDAAKDQGKVAEKVAELAQKIADLTELSQKLLAENKELKAAAPKPAIATIKG